MNRDVSRRTAYVIACLCSLAFLTIVDRVAISAAKNDMAAEFGMSDAVFGWVFGAFAIGYTLLMIPSGWLADRWGPRKTLASCVLLWSLLTALTGWANGTAFLLLIRFLFGIAEAGAFPGAARAIANWLPIPKRGLAMGLLNTGSRLGAAFGLWGMSLSVVRFGWRFSFLLLGMAGVAWALVWYLWFRDRPDDGVPPSPPKVQTTDRRLIRSPSVHLILFQYFASQVTFYLCFTWLLPYVKTHYALSTADAGMYASMPLYVGALANWVSGTIVDRLYRRGHRSLSRKLPAMCGFGLASVTLLVAASMETAAGFILFFSLATFGVDLTLSPSWTACADIGGRHTGTLSGAMNMMGSLGGLISSVAFPWLFGMTGSIRCYLYLAVFLNLAAMGCWALAFREERNLEVLTAANDY